MKLQHIARKVMFVPPRPELEYEEVQRYEELQGLSLEEWSQLVSTGQPTVCTPQMLSMIGNSTSNTVDDANESWDELDADKKERALAAINKGVVEYPIVLRRGNTLDLLAGNTRLTALVKMGLPAKVLIVDVKKPSN